ncbi:hypothetical protein [Roseomonas harenae]|jgi:hypothetical protein|uniref:hypothetical protein n=1 Tax=Muricoccus harenae TaxID=2692566 RepID=UPI001331651B|nr:hypothetical protein [Roseomonas harenae]
MRNETQHGDDAMIAVVGRAVERVLARVPFELRDEALRVLRDQLDYTLANSPIEGPIIDEMRVRARLAAAFAAYSPAAGGEGSEQHEHKPC